jgi:hypothetical protein
MADASAVLRSFDTVNAFIEASRAQTDLVTKISTAGVGGVLATFGCVLGLRNDLQLARFRYSWFLVVPLIAFTLSVVTGYVTLAEISGFRYELVTGLSATSVAILNPVSHFTQHYMALLTKIALTQLLSSIFGILTLAVWYSANAVFTGGSSHAVSPDSSFWYSADAVFIRGSSHATSTRTPSVSGND